jgi:hypothetical protein
MGAGDHHMTIAILAAKAHRVAMLAVLALASLWPALSAHAQACSYQLGDNRITYGALFASADPGERALGTRSTTLTVTCPTPRDMTLEFIDVMPDSVSSSWALESAGRFNVRLSNVTVDGVPADLSGSGGSEVQTMTATQMLAPDREVTPFRNGAPVQGTTLTARVDVSAWLDQGITVSDQTTWSGHGRLRFAASGDEVPLDVEAMMIPGSCNITVEDVVLDNTPRSAFHPTQAIPRPETTNEAILQISCAAPGMVGVWVTDNRANDVYLVDGAPQTLARSFGLGRTSMNNKIGAYQVRITQAFSSTPGLTLLEGSNGSGWSPIPPPNAFFTTATNRFVTMGDTNSLVPQPMSWMTMYYVVRAWLAPNSVANITGPEAFDGSATFTIEYL